ncbi:hypothetical protein PoB_000225200 [Plakobranchus ocellatus]|uniref:Uncharacterized protein n=1 Tax=Plakobranchus ocellatus TaxID=259542 RepID=A0AAV3XZY2_9GAST|nr:hypothetical protein PoB_000225200 [Plakobranchus ocellatus]
MAPEALSPSASSYCPFIILPVFFFTLSSLYHSTVLNLVFIFSSPYHHPRPHLHLIAPLSLSSTSSYPYRPDIIVLDLLFALSCPYHCPRPLHLTVTVSLSSTSHSPYRSHIILLHVRFAYPSISSFLSSSPYRPHIIVSVFFALSSLYHCSRFLRLIVPISLFSSFSLPYRPHIIFFDLPFALSSPYHLLCLLSLIFPISLYSSSSSHRRPPHIIIPVRFMLSSSYHYLRPPHRPIVTISLYPSSSPHRSHIIVIDLLIALCPYHCHRPRLCSSSSYHYPCLCLSHPYCSLAIASPHVFLS